ncbi:MAG: extracellular solute-binding protein, partial [Deinococcota bacterium]
MKRFSLLLAVLLLIPAGFAQEKTELRIAWWGSQNRHDRTIQVIELFEELNPNVDVIFEPSGWNDHWTKMTTQAAGNNLPDIMQQDYARLQEWVSRDLLLPLDDYMGTTIDTSYIGEASLAGGMVGDELYAINLGTNSQTIILDVDAFEAAGLELPSPDWTWEEFEEIAMTLHNELGIWAIGPGLYNDQMWKSLYMGYGQWSYDDSGAALGYEDDEPFVAYLEMIQRLIDAGAVPSRAEDVAEFQDQGVEAIP